jgi:hypothetical protein
MRNAKSTTLAWLIASVFIISHCTPDQTFKISTEETLARNSWAVDYFFQNQELTGEFDNYRLTFTPSGIFTCRNTTTNELSTGNWNKVVSANQAEIIGININCNNPSVNKLSGSWSLIMKNGKIIHFEDIHPANSVLRIKVQP